MREQAIEMPGANDMQLEWLDDWMKSEKLTLDIVWPHGVDPSKGAAGLLTYAWEVSTARWQLSSDRNDISVRWLARLPGLPVFSVEWQADVPGVTMDHFVSLNLTALIEKAAEWDTTFDGAEYLATHGKAADLRTFARLVQWRFRAGPLQRREMLYMMIPTIRGDRVMLSYLSVTSPLHPPTAGCMRARNLAPSFDLAEPLVDGSTSGLRLYHLMTTDIGGWVPWWMWNRWFKPAVLSQSAEEGERVRAALMVLATK